MYAHQQLLGSEASATKNRLRRLLNHQKVRLTTWLSTAKLLTGNAMKDEGYLKCICCRPYGNAGRLQTDWSQADRMQTD